MQNVHKLAQSLALLSVIKGNSNNNKANICLIVYYAATATAGI